jgi:hypothetical protein
MEALKNMYKSIAQTEKMAAIENVADPKLSRMVKSLRR